MLKQNLESGRIEHKLKTRMAILEAAKKIMSQQADFRLEDVAEEAGISRATIYRYFPNIQVLSLETAIDIQAKTPDELFEMHKKLSVRDQLLKIQKYYIDLALDNERTFRNYLSASLKQENDPGSPNVRGARRVESLKKSLEKVKDKVDPGIYQKLISFSSVIMGFEPIIVAKDVCGYRDPHEIHELLEWGFKKILDSVPELNEPGRTDNK